MSNDQVVRAMLAMSETIRVQLLDEATGVFAPAKPKMAIKCAMGALSLAQSEEAKANCHLQLGKLLHFYTDNFEDSKKNLECAYRSYSSFGDYYTPKRLEAAATLCELYINARCWNFHRVYSLVKTEVNIAKDYGELYYKFLFYYIEANTIDGNYDEAIKTIYNQMKSLEHSQKVEDIVMRLYLYNSANLVSCQLRSCELPESEMATCEALFQQLQILDPNSHHIKYIYNFSTLTKLAHQISDGLNRSSRLILRQMQSDCEKDGKNPQSTKPGIRWLETPAATVITCLMTEITSFFQCNYDRTAKYCSIVLKHADDHFNKLSRTEADYPLVRTLTKIRMYAQELMALSNVMVCKPLDALNCVDDMVRFGHTSSGDYVMDEFTPFIHNILGAQACYLRDFETAEKHYLVAKQQCRQSHALAYLNMSIGLIYLFKQRMAEYPEIVREILKLNTELQNSYLLENNVRLFSAIDAFASGNTNTSHYLKLVLDGAKSESLLRLHSIGLLLYSLTMPITDVSVFKPSLDWCPQSRDHLMSKWCKSTVAEIIENNIKTGQVEKPETVSGDIVTMRQEAWASEQKVSKETLEKDIGDSPLKNYLKWFSGDARDYVMIDGV